MTHKPTVLFVCHHNANRSQIAAGYLRELAGTRVNVESAGPQPSDDLNTAAVQVMREEGIDISAAVPAALTEDLITAADVVITLGCADALSVQHDKRHEDWTLVSNGGHGIDAARHIRDQLRARVEGLIADLLT